MTHYIVYTKDMLGNEEDIAVYETEYNALLYSALYNDKKDWRSNASFVKSLNTRDLIEAEHFTISWRYPVWRWVKSTKWNVEAPQATLSTVPRFFISRVNKQTEIIEGYIVMDRKGYSDYDVIETLKEYMAMEGK